MQDVLSCFNFWPTFVVYPHVFVCDFVLFFFRSQLPRLLLSYFCPFCIGSQLYLEHGVRLLIQSLSYLEACSKLYFSFPDPRQWSCQDVRNWLDWMSCTYNIRNIDVLKFHMNGKALCLMTLDMFLYRVPTGGNLLYHDFQSRLQRTVHGDR